MLASIPAERAIDILQLIRVACIILPQLGEGAMINRGFSSSSDLAFDGRLPTKADGLARADLGLLGDEFAQGRRSLAGVCAGDRPSRNGSNLRPDPRIRTRQRQGLLPLLRPRTVQLPGIQLQQDGAVVGIDLVKNPDARWSSRVRSHHVCWHVHDRGTSSRQARKLVLPTRRQPRPRTRSGIASKILSPN